MEAAALSLCPILLFNPLRPHTSTCHKLTIISRPHGLRIFHRRSLFSDHEIRGHKLICCAENGTGKKGDDRIKEDGDDKSPLEALLAPVTRMEGVQEAGRKIGDIVTDYVAFLKRKREPPRKGPPPTEELKNAARTLEMNAEFEVTEEAIKNLRRLYEELRIDDKRHTSMGQETYLVGLLLVEMHMFQGEYKEAKEVVEHCEGVIPNDVIPKLYQSVICLMEDPEKKDSEAEEFWNKFTKPADADNVSSSSPPKTGEDTNGPTPTIDKDKLEKLTFDQFKVKMKKLREKIEARRKAAMQK